MALKDQEDPKNISAKLIQAENLDFQKIKDAKIKDIYDAAFQIEKILIEKNLTWKDWGMVMEIFNEKAEAIFPMTTMKEVKEKFVASKNIKI